MTVVRSKRHVLAVQASGIVTLAGIAGWFIQRSTILQTSALGRLSERSGVPVIELAIWCIAVAVAVTILLDHWNSRLEFHDEYLLIRERLGITKIRYQNIALSKSVPLGAGIALRDPAEWLQSFEGSDSGFAKLCRISGFLKGVYGCDLVVKRIRLDVGTAHFLELLEERLKSAGVLAGVSE